MSKNKKLALLATIIFLGFGVFWLVLAQKGLQGDSDAAERFSALYGIMALFGGIVGLFVSRKWGGFRSVLGRAIGFISLGLLAQEVGQLTYSGYTYLVHQEIPYPSLGDIGFFGSVVLYILAGISLIRAVSTKSTRSSTISKAWTVLLPLVLLAGSYIFFLRDYSYDFSHWLTVALDFGYPLGQAFYISLGLLTLVLSKRYLGGVMKPAIFFLIFALLLQYVSDFTFLYQVSRDTWKTAGINEFMYLASYYIMTLSLIMFGMLYDKVLKASASEAPAGEE
jgi:hypothetical protein